MRTSPWPPFVFVSFALVLAVAPHAVVAGNIRPGGIPENSLPADINKAAALPPQIPKITSIPTSLDAMSGAPIVPARPVDPRADGKSQVEEYLAAAAIKAKVSLLTETMRGAMGGPNLISASLANADAAAGSDHYAQIGRTYALLQSGRELFPWMPETIELLWPEKNGRMSRYRDGIPSPGVALTLGESRYVLALLTQSHAPIPAYMPFAGQAPFPGAFYYYFDKDPAGNTDRLMTEESDGWVVYRLSPRVEPGESLLWHDYYLLWTSHEPKKHEDTR